MNKKDDIKLKVKASFGDQSLGASIQGDEEVVSKFLSGIVPGFIKNGVGIINDNVAFWRFKNQVNIIKETEKTIASSGLKKQQVPLKVLYPIFQNASLEEDPNMQKKWANLLANAATGNNEITPSYGAILNELSPIEVAILDKVFDEANSEADYQNRKNMQFSSIKIQEIFGITEKKSDLIIENIFRLNLFQPPADRGFLHGNFYIALRTTKVFEFTTLGYEFVKACRWDVNKN
ncbi:MAG: Abi-alpha family protein [Candidatus Babeliales bacterium]|jgi:hypothetical protein